MDSPERGALMLVRLIATALIGWTAVELALDWLVCDHKHVPMKAIPVGAKSLPLAIGLVLLIKSKAVAQWISDKLDE
jgi:hypothetical protein